MSDKEINDKLDMILKFVQMCIELHPDLKEGFNGMRVPDQECAGDCPECDCK